MVQAVGHRGAAGVVAENTLKSFAYAIELGVDAVECDVHLSADGHVIVMHDEAVDRTTDGTGKIAEMTLEQLRRLDAGEGQPPPTLEELLETVRGRVRLLCELKADGSEAPAVDAVVARRMESDVTFVSFSFDRLERVRGLRGDLRIGAILSSPRIKDMKRALALGACHVGVQYKNLTLAAVDRARAAGIEIGAWTPNRLPEMEAIIALGVTHVTTDRPDILMQHLNRHGG